MYFYVVIVHTHLTMINHSLILYNESKRKQPLLHFIFQCIFPIKLQANLRVLLYNKTKELNIVLMSPISQKKRGIHTDLSVPQSIFKFDAIMSMKTFHFNNVEINKINWFIRAIEQIQYMLKTKRWETNNYNTTRLQRNTNNYNTTRLQRNTVDEQSDVL